MLAVAGGSSLNPGSPATMDTPREIPLGRYTLAGPPGPGGVGSPTSDGGGDVRSTASSERDYPENARLVSSALSDDGMTPLIQPALTRKERLMLLGKRLVAFVLSHAAKFFILALVITLIILVSIKGFGFFGDILAWFQRHKGWAGWGIFVGMYTLVVALFLPGVVLILGAGFVFGFWRGLLAVWAGGAVGQALAFLLARYLLHEWVENTLKHKWKKWAIIDKAIEHDGWKLVLIMRFSPIIPYNLLNIAMATTSIPFWQFTVVSAVGIVFECAVFAYFGSMADNIHTIISGQGGPPPVFNWVMLGISAMMCVLGALFVSYSVKQAIKRAQSHMSVTQLDGLGAEAAADDPELGVRLHPTYPASLEREGFVGSSTAYNLPSAMLSSSPSSPEFELKAVGSSSSTTAAVSKEKARLLASTAAGSSIGGSGLGPAGGSSSSSLATPGGVTGAASATVGRNMSAKLKVSPQASTELKASQRQELDAATRGELPPKATRRHGSASMENVL